MPILVEPIESLEAFAQLEAEWDELFWQSSPKLPFATSSWARLWLEHFAEHTAAVHDRLTLRAVRSSDGQLLGVAPLVCTERPATGPVRVRVLQPIGSDPNVTEIRGTLCRKGAEVTVAKALVAQLKREYEAWDWLKLGGVLQGSPEHQALTQALDVEATQTIPDYVLRLPSSWEALKAGLSRNMKEALRKCVNSPKRDGLNLELFVEPSCGEALERFFALHAERSALTGTVRHRDVFVSSQAKRFLRAYAAESEARRELVIFELKAGGETVATRLGFLFGDELYLYFSGERTAFAKYSVLTRLMAEIFQWAIGAGVKLVNLSPGTDHSKTRWNPEPVPLVQLVALSPSARGPIVRQLYRGVEAIRTSERLRSSPLVGSVLQLASRSHATATHAAEATHAGQAPRETVEPVN